MGILNSTSSRNQDEAELNASSKQKREKFSKDIRNASYALMLLSAFLIVYAFYNFFSGGFSNPIFSVEYPIALAVLVAGLVLYVTYQFDKYIHEHLDDIQSQFNANSSQKPST